MKLQITPIKLSHVAGFQHVLDTVAKERKFLPNFEAPPLSQVQEFVELNITNNRPQFVAIHETQVVGWCDIIQKNEPIRHHCGVLGMGLLPEYRGQGFGLLLLQTTLGAAKKCNLTRVELKVRASNKAAIGLYKKAGFLIEGTLKDGMIIDGHCENTHIMALIQY